MRKYNIVSADSHLDLAYLPSDTFTSRVPDAWRDRVPRAIDNENGRAWVAGEHGEHKLGRLGGSTCRNRRNIRMEEVGFRAEDRRPARQDLRIEDQEKDGVDAEEPSSPDSVGGHGGRAHHAVRM